MIVISFNWTIMIKKLFYTISICLLVTACNFQEAKNIKDCTFTFKSISNMMVNDISFEGKRSLKDFSPSDVALISRGLMTEMPINFTANVRIDNPNNQKAELSALEWILLIKDIEVASGIVDEKTKIDAHQSITIPLEVETNTNVLKNFSLTEIKNIIFNISNSKGLPENSTLKVKPAIMVGKKMVKSPAYITIDLDKK